MKNRNPRKRSFTRRKEKVKMSANGREKNTCHLGVVLARAKASKSSRMREMALYRPSARVLTDSRFSCCCTTWFSRSTFGGATASASCGGCCPWGAGGAPAAASIAAALPTRGRGMNCVPRYETSKTTSFGKHSKVSKTKNIFTYLSFLSWK